MDASESSDDEKNVTESGKPTKLRIVDDVSENDEPPTEHEEEEEEEEKTQQSRLPIKKRTTKRKKKEVKRKQVRPKKTTNPNRKSHKRTAPTGLNGSYWNVVEPDRKTNASVFDRRELLNDEENSSTSSEEHLPNVLFSASSSSSSNDPNPLLYPNKSFITCRSPADSFFLCQIIQNVYQDTKKIRIRWCSPLDDNADETQIDENTRFKFDYTDVLDPHTILTSIPDVVHHADHSISLKKQDIIETKRLLEKSINGDSLSSNSDVPMDLSTETRTNVDREKVPTKKMSPSIPKKIIVINPHSIEPHSNTKLIFDSSEKDDESVVLRTKKSPPKKGTKRKVPSDETIGQKGTPKKRARKTTDSGTAAPVRKRRRTVDIDEISDSVSKKPSKKAAAPAAPPKTKLFKVQSNRLLQENPIVTTFRKEPFFEDNLPVPFISSTVQGKLAIRAVLIDDENLLKSLINDTERVCSIHLTRGVHNDLSAIHYAIKYDNFKMLDILLEDIEKPKEKRCPLPTVAMTMRNTGRSNIRTFGFRTAQIMSSRGAKEGNDALNKDVNKMPAMDDEREILVYALKNNCSRQIFDRLVKTYHNSLTRIYEKIYEIVRVGHRKLAASIIGDVKDNGFYGFNFLHHQVLLYDTEDITINRAASVLKKTKDNFQLTPIHCAAINPNSKYLKQLLNIMPEINVLDKYERRPIHFAAACEGPEPLEYLLSKHANFNDVDRGGNSPLHIAVSAGRAINAEILLRTAKEKAESNDAEDQVMHAKFGLASINRPTKARLYPLHLAVMNNNLECVKVLLEFGADVDTSMSTASGKATPLMLACQKGFLKIVMHLIDRGARVEARDRFKRTPLIHACMCGNAHVVAHLLRLGANPNVFDSSLNTALHYAIAYGWYFCVRTLLEAGANINCVNSWQTTCLAAGFLKGHYGLCDYLLTQHKADINFKTDDGLTLVMLTVGLEISSSAVQQLDYVVTKHKADCTSLDSSGSNAFHYLAGNSSGNEIQQMDSDAKKILHDNVFRMGQILFDHNCDPNKMNSKAQSPLMIALETSNLILVDYLINRAKVEITSDISHDGKTLLHYFAVKCREHDISQTLIKLPANNEMKKMGQMSDNSGRTPLHYCAMVFDQFCKENKKIEKEQHGTSLFTGMIALGTKPDMDLLKMQYQSIVKTIEYCLEAVECDPDAEIKSIGVVNESEEQSSTSIEENDSDEDEDEEKEEEEETEKSQASEDNDETSKSSLKETSIFSLLRTVPFVDSPDKHPLRLLLQKTKNINVLHHQNHRTPLLQAIALKESDTARLLINHSSCNINLATSNIANERGQTALILACQLQLLSIARELLANELSNIAAIDHRHNQAIHYLLQTSHRSNEFIQTLTLMLEKCKSTTINSPGKGNRTPLHVAVYHNAGTIDTTTDVEQILIDNGSDLMAKDELGNIPLHNVFVNTKTGDDPVELCMTIMKAMKFKSLDIKNNQGNTPLHLAVSKCSTVCVMILQQHQASLLVENNLGNSMIGTCIASNHLNLFITFLQTVDIDLGKMFTTVTKTTIESSAVAEPEPTPMLFGRRTLARKQPVTRVEKKRTLRSKENTWLWKFARVLREKTIDQRSLILLIVERDWQGALSLILNDPERFHLSQIQIIEAAILTEKLNLVLRLLMRNKEKEMLRVKNTERRTLFHLLANLDRYDVELLKQIVFFLLDNRVEWHMADKFGCYPLHYACVKHNFVFLDALREKNLTTEINLQLTDGQGNTAIGLLFWSCGYKTTFATSTTQENLRSLITTKHSLDCLCTYGNETAINPLSFGHIDASTGQVPYPPSTNTEGQSMVRTSPLINAIVHNDFELVKFLLELGANVNFADEEKRTPLMHAVRLNNIDIVKLLLDKDYRPSNDEIKTTATKFPRHRGVRRKVLRHSRALPTGPQNFFLGVTTTTAAGSDDETDMQEDSSKFRVTSSIDLNASDALGRTCIHHLVQPFPDGSFTSNLDLLRLLHSCGASLIVHDLAGLSPLQYGAINGCQHICDELTKLMNDGTNTRATIEHFDMNDPNQKLLLNVDERPDFYADAQRLIDEYIAKHPPSTHNSAYDVDPQSNMTLTGEVLVDTDKNIPFDVRLTKTDVSYGTFGLYNFYRMQIIKHKSKTNLYFLFTRWGRIGDEGQNQLTPFSTLDECRKEFFKVFREKTGNAWKDVEQFEVKPKKYTLIQLNQREMRKYPSVPLDIERLQASKQPPSKLHSSIYVDLMHTFMNQQAIRTDTNKSQLDVEWMPVSQLTRETLQHALDILIQIKTDVTRKIELDLAARGLSKAVGQTDEMKQIIERIYQHSNEYYSLVPLRGYADEKLAVIADENALKQQEKILEDLLEIELSYKMLLGAQANLNKIPPTDYLYKSIGCAFEAMTKDDIDSQLILRYIWASAPDVHVEQIFKIARPDEDQRLAKRNLDNHYLLWHGTGICNLISILTRGLLVGPLAATATGSLFGKGIYTADVFSKSLGYCSGVKDKDGERCFMLLCEVALGNAKEVGLNNNDDDDDDDKKLDLTKYQSRKALGRQIPDPRHTITRNYGVRMPLGKTINNPAFGQHNYGGLNFNEYIVYDESQVALRYLVQFRR